VLQHVRTGVNIVDPFSSALTLQIKIAWPCQDIKPNAVFNGHHYQISELALRACQDHSLKVVWNISDEEKGS
jgi:hypothetical protein